MKNLKKVLALGLALVMMLGMLTIASAAETKKLVATEFSDWSEVEHRDAVSLMVDLGVINGTDAGTYAPKANIDRGSWAKMVYFVLTGETTATYYVKDYPTFADIKAHWAEGCMEYLAANEIMVGDGVGNFLPFNQITVVGAAKTMLVGLGFDASVEKYANDPNWPNNVMTRARKVGLLDGINQKQDDPITRDNAAQMIYNALSANTVVAEQTLNFMTGQYVPSGKYADDVTLAEKAFGIKKVTAKVDDVVKGVAQFEGSTWLEADGKTEADVPDGEVKASLNDAGKVVTLWVGIEDNKIVSSSVAAAASKLVKTVKDGVDWTKAFDTENKKANKDAYIGEKADNCVYYKNGEKGTLPTAGASKSGAVVEFYATDGKIDIVHEYEYTVDTIKSVKATTKDDKTTVTVEFGTSAKLTAVPSSQISGDWASLKEDDVVLFYKTGASSDETQLTIEKVEVGLTGKVTSFKDDKVRVAGKEYEPSELTTGAVTSAWTDVKKGETEYDFYLGKDGKVCHVAAVGEEASKDLVLITNVLLSTDQTLDDTTQTVTATALFVDGTKQNVTLASVTYAAGTKCEGSDIVGTAGEKFANGEFKKNVELGFFTYKIDKDGKYALTADTDSQKSVGTVAMSGTNYIDGAVTGNNSTIYIVEVGESVNHKDATRTVYTGYKNAPKLGTDGTVNAAVAYGDKDSTVAKYVFISVTALDGADSNEMFFVPDASDIYTDNVNECKVLVVYNDKGQKVELKVDSETDLSGKGFFVEVKSVSDKDVYTLKTGKIEATDAAVLDGGVLTVGTNYVAFDSATELKIITLDDEGAVASYEDGNFNGSFKDDNNTYKAYVVGGDAEKNTPADVVYVIVAPVAAE